MRYKVGMYGGSFDPLHIGHIHDMIRAAAMCEELYIMISWCQGRESTSKELRYRWIYNSIKHLRNVKLIMIEDKAVSKEEYNTDYYWEKGAIDIKNTIGKPIDIVFCGSDYKGTNRFESLYEPESVVHYFDRTEVPISSTEIRTWALDHWDYIPGVCKSHYAKKVLIVGGESTGKSTLVQNLALAYNTNYVTEVGRETCEYAGGEDLMLAEDLYENFLRQKLNTMEAAKHCNRIVFVDTDALTTLFYSNFLLEGENENIKICTKFAEAISKTNIWDLVIFLEPEGTVFIQDGTRNENIKQERKKFSDQLKSFFQKYQVPFESISGDYLERFNKTKELIETKLNLTTKW